MKTLLQTLMSGTNNAAKLIHRNNCEKGFWDKERNVGELLMLTTSELGEAMEAHRKGRFTDKSVYAENASIDFEAQVKDTFEDEIADAVIRLYDLSAGLGIDLEKHIVMKVEYNATRKKLHGKRY